jgi:acyl-CoA synthetase (AMP-forming)/AMP-acid ligase II
MVRSYTIRNADRAEGEFSSPQYRTVQKIMLTLRVITFEIQDTLKVSGAQVSPVEIGNCLLQHPDKLINDVTVAGVSGGRIPDEKVPRAWIVLPPAGEKCGVAEVVRELSRKNVSKYNG